MVKISDLTIFEFINKEKVTLFLARTTANFPHFPCQVDHIRFPSISCQRETRKIFSITSVTWRILRICPRFFYYLINMNIKWNPSLQFWSVYFCYGFIHLFLCSSRFDWENYFLLSGYSFSEELTSYWHLTFKVASFSGKNKKPSLEHRYLYLQGEVMGQSCWWVSNVIMSILLNKRWFSYIRGSLKQDEYHV